MDKYQKKALLFSVICVIALYVTIAIGFNLHWFTATLVLGIFGILGVVFLKVNKSIKPYLNPNTYPTNKWYRQHFERNFDCILLGDEISETDFRSEVTEMKGLILPLFLKDQNLSECFLVLLSSFSILKPNGKVILFLRPGFLKYADDGINDERRFYWAVSEYVFGRTKWKCTLIKICTRIPALLLRFRDIRYFVRKCFIKELYSYDKKKKLQEEERFLVCTGKEERARLEQKQKSILCEMKNFCEQRDIILEVNDIKRNNNGDIG